MMRPNIIQHYLSNTKTESRNVKVVGRIDLIELAISMRWAKYSTQSSTSCGEHYLLLNSFEQIDDSGRYFIAHDR